MLDTFLRESPFYQEILAEGEQRGEQKGELKGLRESILALVQQRFPDLAQTAEARLVEISDPAQLRAMVVQVAIAPDEAAASQTLGLSA